MSSGNPSSGARRGGRGGPGGGPSPAGSRGGGAGGGMRRKNNANANRNAGNNKTSSGGKQSAQASDLPAGGGVAKQLDEKIASATEALTISSTPGDSTEVEAETDGDADIEAAPAGTVDGEVCWICADPVKYASVAECNHRTCHVCALRLRALYKKMECTFCKNPQPKVIFTNSMARPWEEYTLDMIPFSDDKLKISFETSDMMEETLFLLRFNCPDTECTFTGTGWADLKWHTKDMHGLILCDLCIRHKKIFAHEHTLYTPKQIMQHMPSLKRPPALPPQHQNRSKDPDKGGKGKGKEVPESEEGPVDAHPLCSFCKECFYDDDALYAHLRERHEECFVCKRAGERNVYFQNWQKLVSHALIF
ncbi:hypothetical protein DL93DRAFT_1671469 [Clavulina sp. PMI_390]|nr:hypothetical protein DL93DRAFT_1671469 [Clavulina sp. PMI_390]